ncbi:MAG TPA: hypothetical protein VLC92_11035 [Rhodocyclaceae bacterium]|nr:hypothetical protein [Rhodocyclaceae bacterium]
MMQDYAWQMRAAALSPGSRDESKPDRQCQSVDEFLKQVRHPGEGRDDAALPCAMLKGTALGPAIKFPEAPK